MSQITLNAVVSVLNEIQLMNGQPIGIISDTTCPMTDLVGFDSYHAVEASALLSDKLGCDINAEVMFPSAGGSYPTVGMIIERIDFILEKQRKGQSYGRGWKAKKGYS